MTVYDKVKSTLATLQGIAADFKTLYLETDDNVNGEMFKRLAAQSEDILVKLQNRVKEIESEEPQYRKDR